MGAGMFRSCKFEDRVALRLYLVHMCTVISDIYFVRLVRKTQRACSFVQLML